MKADISKEERRRLQAEQEAEIRAALVPRHITAVEEQQSVDAALFVLGTEQLNRAADAITARAAAPVCVPAPVAAPVVIPAPALVPAPEPVVARQAPDGLRQRLGLR